MIKSAQPIIIKIAEIIDEASPRLASLAAKRAGEAGPNYKTFVFDYPLKAEPGQYVMLWQPGLDLKPFSIAWQTEKQFALTVLKRGQFTTKLFDLKKGDTLGFIGPQGTSYDFKNKEKILLVGAGCGTPSVTFLAQKARKENIRVDFVLAASSKEEIIFAKWLTDQGVKVYHRFQDKRFNHSWELILDLLNQNKYDGLYACGPELMLKKIVDWSLEKNIFCQVSLERYMKCGLGICGSCCVDPLGICLCTEGTVVDAKLANQITEFGKYYRDASGAKISF